MKSPRIALVGVGYWGKNLARNLSQIGALAAICDTSERALEELCEAYPACRCFTSYREVLDDRSIEAIAIAAPAEEHGSMVREALLAGKDVFVEKPLCLSVEEGGHLVELAQARNQILMVGHLLWYHPAVLKLKELIDDGELGRIQYLYSNRVNAGRIRREENILWSFAPHDISVILGLLHEMPNAVQAHGGNYLNDQIADTTISLLSFPSGVKAHIFVSWLHPFKEQKLVIVGDKKMAVFCDTEPTDKLLLYPHAVEWKNQIPVINKAEAQKVSFDSAEPLKAECLHFVECIRTRRPPKTDGAEGLKVLMVLDQCQQALDLQSQLEASEPADPETTYSAHPSAFIDDQVEIGDGTVIWHVSHIMQGSEIGKNCRIGQNVVVGPNARIGDDVKIQNNVSVYQGVTLEDGVFCGPSMVFTNVLTPRSAILRTNEFKDTLVKKGATLGANCTIICGVTIGQHAFVGAGAVVSKDVPDHALVYGSPAKIQGWACECGAKLVCQDTQASCLCGRTYKISKDSISQIESSSPVVSLT